MLLGGVLHRAPLAVQGEGPCVLVWEQGAPGALLVPLSALPALLTTSHMYAPLVPPAQAAAKAVRCRCDVFFVGQRRPIGCMLVSIISVCILNRCGTCVCVRGW